MGVSAGDGKTGPEGICTSLEGSVHRKFLNQTPRDSE